MKNVVVAIEFDEELDDIVEFTADLLDGKDTAVHVVHVYQAHAELVEYAPHLVEAMNAYEDHLQEQAAAIRSIVTKLIGKKVHAQGYMKPIKKEIVHAILEFAEEKSGELIIVGTHHPGQMERLFLGSVSEKLLRHSDLPVAVVPRHRKE